MNIDEALTDPELFQPWFPGPTWNGWRTVLKAAYCLPMDEAETEFFRTIAERDPQPSRFVSCGASSGDAAARIASPA